jgi:hypothetical protein
MLARMEAETPDEAEPQDIPSQNWIDLAETRPGVHLEQQAVTLRQTAPGRILLARVLRVHTDERAYRVGAKGERQVASQLDKLGAGWHFLHSLVISETGTDVDHLVVGPAGVFCINSKNHPGKKIWVGGDTVLIGGQREPSDPFRPRFLASLAVEPRRRIKESTVTAARSTRAVAISWTAVLTPISARPLTTAAMRTPPSRACTPCRSPRRGWRRR